MLPLVASTVLDLWRGWPGSDKVFVNVGLPDGSSALFLVDTGASISVLNEDIAERLGLHVFDAGGTVNGLSGSVPWMKATIPHLQLGEFGADNIDVAVGVPGAPRESGPLPIAGILGNNVWRNFTLVVDYPRDQLELYPPGTYHARGRSAQLVVGDNHLYTPVRIIAKKDKEVVDQKTMLEIDTGAEDLSLWCQTGEPFRDVTTLGVEHVIGIGADLDRIPDYSFLSETRRIPVASVEIGGRKLVPWNSVRWNSPDEITDACAVTPGLIGYGILHPWRVVIDYQGGKLTLEKPRGKPRRFDALAGWLNADRVAFGADPIRAAPRARVIAGQGDLPQARALVEAGLRATPTDPQLVVLLARLQRNGAEYAAAVATLSSMTPSELAGEDEWVSFVNSLVLEGKTAEAVDRARAAVNAGTDDEPAREDFYVALSDALLAAGRPTEAQAALDQAISIDMGGSAFLFRRARIALAEGDRYSAITTLRGLMQVYPIGGMPMWLYAMSAKPEDRETFRTDLDRALGRLHPGSQPFDFVGAAWLAVGEEVRGGEALTTGYARDCSRLPASPERDNCDAWYWALQHKNLDQAAARMKQALAAQPTNSAFHDTAAVVSLAAGDAASAFAHAQEAARLSPWDPYLLWQVGRMKVAADVPAALGG